PGGNRRGAREARDERLSHDAPRANRLERIAGTGDEVHLQPPLRADEDDGRFRPPASHLVREGERRKDVPARAAARDEIGAIHDECCDRLRRIPTAMRSAQRADPPYERNGSGIPLVGRSERTTETLTSAWTTIMTERPTPTYR